MSGRYNLTAPINLRGWLTLEGDGAESTVLRVVPGSNCNALQFTGPKIENEFFTMIRDLQLHGAPSDTVGTGIQLDSTGQGLADWIVENVFIQRFPVDDMYFNSYNGWAAKILACTFEYAGRYAIEKSDGQDERIIGNKFLYNANGIYLGRGHGSQAIIADNFFYENSGYGICINGSSSNVISANTFFENSWGNDNAYDDIYVQSGSGNEITGNIFAGTTNVRYGVNIDSSGLSNGVTGNNFNAPFRSGPIHNSGQGNLITNNVGFITENSGSTASCVNGTWIAHGLAGAPNGECRLQVNGSRLINNTCCALDPTIIAENSTHVQIEFLCSNNGTLAPVGETEAKPVIWCFEYKP
jgi:parallel beta-helix repeat protein